MSDSSPGPTPPPPFFTPLTAATASPTLASVYPALPAASAPAVSPNRRRATSVPAQREADTATLSASPDPSPSPSPPAIASSSSSVAAATAASPATTSRAELGVSQPSTPVATLSYQSAAPHQSDHPPTLVNVVPTAKVRAPPPLPLPLRPVDSPTRPAAPPSLFPRTPPPSQPSAGAVRLLLPAPAATPFTALFPSTSSHSVPSHSSYHQQRLFGRQRHRVVQGELLQLYLVVPHSQHVLFPWLFASAAPPPPPSPTSPPPSPPVLVSEVHPCHFHVDVRLRVATVRTEEGRDEADASPPPPVSVPAIAAPPTAAVPQPPTSLSLSSAGSLTSPSEPASATSGWSRFATRFGRKSGPPNDKDGSNSAPTAATAAASSLSITSTPAISVPSTVPPSVPPPATSSTAVSLSSPLALLSPQSAPVPADGVVLGRPEPRRTRSLGLMSPTHIPPHIVVAPHSAFQHEPPFHLLPHRPTSLTCSPALHHNNSTTSSGCYQFTLSNGDAVLVIETIMHASSDGHVWLEVEVHSPASHQSLLASLSLPAVSAVASTGSPSPLLPSMAASLRSFMSDHRVLRLPPPHPLAGCLLLISHAVHVHASVQQVNDRVLAEVRVEAHDDVLVESVELLTESARWQRSNVKAGQGRGELGVSVPVAVSSLFSLSLLPVSLPLSLHASEQYHFVFVLEPAVCMSQSMAQLRSDVLKAVDTNEIGSGVVDGRLLTTCVVRWRSEHASTAITSQYDVSWQLPIHVQPSPAADTTATSIPLHSTLPLTSVAAPPTVTLSHPPRVQLHSVFAICVTLHNTSHTALTCTLQLPSDDFHLASAATLHTQPPTLVHSHSLPASNQLTPGANLLSPVSGLFDRPPNGRPFSPVDGFHFPFHSLASRLPSLTATTKPHKPQPNGHTVPDPATVSSGSDKQQQTNVDEDEQAVQQGLVCLDGEVDVGVLAAGGRRTVGLQCVAVRSGFVRLPRLLLQVKESNVCFVCQNDGLLLVDVGT